MSDGSSGGTDRPEIRADLRDTEFHASWREVYGQMEAEGVGHE